MILMNNSVKSVRQDDTVTPDILVNIRDDVWCYFSASLLSQFCDVRRLGKPGCEDDLAVEVTVEHQG